LFQSVIVSEPGAVQHISRTIAGRMKFVMSDPVDVLPFHQMGRFKWEKLGMEYKIKRYATAFPRSNGCSHRSFSRCRIEGVLKPTKNKTKNNRQGEP